MKVRITVCLLGGILIAVAVVGALEPALIPGLNMILLAGLIGVTAFYAIRTAEIAKATKEQADASVKMAEEMREQRVMTSRPVIIEKAVPHKVITAGVISDNFEIYNAGNGPAIELEIFLLDSRKRLLQTQRETFLRAGEQPIKFHPSCLGSHVNSTCYLLFRYRSIISLERRIWYQTWLPFKPVKSQSRDYIYAQPEELEFREVFEKESY